MAWGIWASLGIPGFGHLEADFHPVPEGRFQFGHSEKRLARKIEDLRCEPETGWKPILHCTVTSWPAVPRPRATEAYFYMWLDTPETNVG